MRSYWLWLFLHACVWLFSFYYIGESLRNMPFQLLGVAVYFILFFLIPLVVERPGILLIMLAMNIIIATLTLYPGEQGIFHPGLVLILSLILAEGFFRLSFKRSLLLAGIGTAALSIAVLPSNVEHNEQLLLALYFVMLLIALIFYKNTKDRTDDVETRYEALLAEYRNLKRRIVSEEEMTRQEERVLIAHEIHDSVGHKLTALLMQLEGFRLQAPEEYKEKVQSLKKLASSSLEETRRAVKSLKANDIGGLPGILRLIRKLEMESYIRIHFSVKHGAFTAPLTGEQSFVIYRSVQEGLTNIMKHSNAREAEIMFEAPGGSIFRFEISNPVTDDNTYQEGFGLTSMRERLEKFGGNLQVYKTAELFILKGDLKIGYGGNDD
nr:sensor histidine kinase [Paenibacillus bovis]